MNAIARGIEKLTAGAAVAGLVLAGLVMAGAPTRAGEPAKAQAAPQSWQKLTSLVGTWEGKGPDGKTIRSSYELVANGTALVEKFEPSFESTMVTVYTLDGETPMLTHYCTAGNQPRMRAKAGTNPDVLDFAFVDATNLTSPQAGHMHGLKVSFIDPNHIRQEWTFHQGGKESAHMVADFARVK